MIYSDLIRDYRNITDLITRKRLAESLLEIDKLAVQCRNSDYKNRLDNYTDTYRNILKYSFELGDDPEKEKVYNHLVKSLFELSDDIKEELIRQFGFLQYYKYANYKGGFVDQTDNRAEEWIDQMSLEKEVEDLLNSTSGSKKDHQPGIDDEAMMNHLFQSIWLSDKLREKQINLIALVINNQHLPWYYKSLIVSGLSLSCLRHFDVMKLNILFDFYQKREQQVWQRALTGILICIYIHNNRIYAYPEISQRIKSFNDDPLWIKTVEIIVIQFLRARETEKIAKKLRDEIIPELWKAQSKINEKLNMDELLKDKMLDDKNPEWERVFEDSPDLYNKMEEFSNLQMEGADVFLSAFAMLKRFDFFTSPSNWFIPFYKENIRLEDAFKDFKEGFDKSSFLSGLEKTRFLCNSDKYSFCLNIKHLPVTQRTMMVEFFNMELEAMNEMASEEDVIYTDTQSRSIIVQYIQDLYRFFKLYSLKSEFEDIFIDTLDFHNAEIFRLVFDDNDILRNIGEFYFEKEHFNQALEVFLHLEHEKGNQELYEKIAYSCQKLGEYDQALLYYKKAELQSPSRSWLLNKIALCYRKLGNPDAAIEYYLQSEKVDPENLYIQSSLGQVYMDKDDYEEALKYFYKVEYLAPDNIKVHRPIAWCSFILKKPDQAKKYLEKVINKEGNQYDYMNLGHVYWCLGDRSKAIEKYKTSILKAKGDYAWFADILWEDAPYLIQYNISEFDLPLMLDYLKMNS